MVSIYYPSCHSRQYIALQYWPLARLPQKQTWFMEGLQCLANPKPNTTIIIPIITGLFAPTPTDTTDSF